MNEFQNAFALSQIEYKSTCQGKKLEDLLAKGKYVVGYTALIHCKFTDAVIASEEVIMSVHDTREEAEAEISAEDYDLFLAEPKLEIETVPAPVEDCPF